MPSETVQEISDVSAAARAPVRHGEGIGLSIVKRLCQILDATLALDSTPARGTTFTIVLPRRYPSGAEDAPSDGR